MSAHLRHPASRSQLQRRLLSTALWFAAIVLQTVFAASSPAQEPIREIINRELSPPTGSAWPKASDAEFLRRVSLDLNGMPPGSDQARAFIADIDPQKREKLIDQLLGSPLYDRHIATTLDIMLMERRANTHVAQDTWMAWLLTSIRQNKPWNVLAREIMTADGDTPDNRGPARFYLDRNSEPHVITRDLGRIFFGRDFQCNQCHDSPLVSDYLQRDYYGILAFASTGYAVTKKVADKDVTVFAERAPSDLTFESVFNKGNGHRTTAMLPGSSALTEPFFFPGEEYITAPADGIRAVPKFSRRSALADLATNGTNHYFNENIANRLWAMMLGRGLVHPLDMMHSDNPAASPQLLKTLGERIAASGFDMKQFLREIALSDVYQRPFDISSEMTNSIALAKAEHSQVASMKDLLAVQARDLSTAGSEAEASFDTAEKALLPAAAEVDKARNAYAEARKKLDDAQKALNDASAALNSKTKALESLQAAITPLQSASGILSNDPQLAEALKVLTDRVAKVTAELPPLQTAVTEKTTAVTPATEALTTVRPPLETALAAMKPLLDAVSSAQQNVVTTREAMTAARLAAKSTESRLASLERLVAAADADLAVKTAQSSIVSNEAALQAATQQVTEFLSTMDERAKGLQAAEQAIASSVTAVTAAQQQVERNRQAESNLIAAVASLKNVQAALPPDEQLSTSLGQLNAKTEVVKSLRASSEQQLLTASQLSLAAEEELKKTQLAMTEASAEMQRRHQAVEGMNAALKLSQESLTSSASALQSTMEHVPGELANRFALSQLKPLTPEQMCWSVFKVTTVYDRYVAQEVAELDKASPPTDVQKSDPAFLNARAIETEQRVFTKLASNISSYVQIYGGAPGQPQNEFFASPDQALFTSNGGAINGWVAPGGDNATERIIKATDPKLAAEELYLGILTRMPTDDEVSEVTQFLATRSDKPRAAQELVWGLISSAEFRFNR